MLTLLLQVYLQSSILQIPISKPHAVKIIHNLFSNPADRKTYKPQQLRKLCVCFLIEN